MPSELALFDGLCTLVNLRFGLLAAIRCAVHEGPVRCRFLGRHAGRLNKSGALLGVGEALKREIAGLGVMDRLLLWGFDRRACLGSDLTDPLNGARWTKRVLGFAGSWSIRAVFCRRHQLLLRRQLDQRMMMGSQVMSPAAEGVVRNV